MSDQVVVFSELETLKGLRMGVARLNAPRALNALSLDMIRLLDAQLRQWQQDDNIVAVWLEGEGDRAFCAGGDVVKMYESMQPVGERNTFLETYFAEEYQLDYLLHLYAKPLLCWGHGVVMGGGMGLLQGARFRIVTESARMAMPEITIGLYPDVGGSWFLQRTPGKTGLFAGLTGLHLNASDALFMTLAEQHIKAQQQASLKQACCALSYSNDSEHNAGLIGALLEQFSSSPEAPSRVAEHFDQINHLCGGATLAQVVERLDAWSTEDAWLAKALAAYRKGSVQTVRLVWEQLQRARYLSLADIFRMEWILSVRCGMGTEFREGVRALLVDKDNHPAFYWKNIEDITAQELALYFQSPLTPHPLAGLGR